ncbi:MAG: SDR family NAD(P)-dependent oxidoreductase [Bacteroidota bacterium]
MKLKGKKALITGGTGELGRAVTKCFESQGAEVAVTYYSDSEAASFLKEFPDVLALKGDLSKEGDVQQLFASYIDKKGWIDILCNLVGGYMPKRNITELSEKEWDFMLALNLKTCFLCTQHALRIMQGKKYGRIVNVSAMAGLSPEAGRGAYGISKSAIATFTQIVGEEMKLLSDSNITANAIAPSVLLTESNRRTASKEEARNWVTLEQASNLIAFLASDEASSINGETIKIYGGL